MASSDQQDLISVPGDEDAERCDLDLDLDLSVDQYARKHGLSVAFQLDPLQLISSSAELLRHPRLEGGPDDDSQVPTLHLPPLPRDEPPLPTGEAADFINSLSVRSTEEEIWGLASHICMPTRNKSVKLESPLLRSDHALDCRRLQEAINTDTKYMAELNAGSVPADTFDASKDEGIEFPAWVHRARDELEASLLQGERITVTEEAIRSVYEAIQGADWSAQHTSAFIEKLTQHRTPLQQLQLSPPLSPIKYGQEEAYFPGREECQIPMSSDTMLADDLDDVDRAIFDEQPSSPPKPSAQLSISDSSEPRLLSPVRLDLDAVKVEVPLASMTSTTSSLIAVDIREVASGLDLARRLPQMDVDSDSEGHSLFDANLHQKLQTLEMDITRSIEQERLDPVDALARVAVPVMDFSAGEHEWTVVGSGSLAHYQHLCHEWDNLNVPIWTQVYAVPERELNWCVFPIALGEVSLEEELEPGDGAEDSHGLVENAEPIPTSADYVWKSPGLAVLRTADDDDEDVELLPSFSGVLPKPPPPVDTEASSLTRKRKLEWAELNAIKSSPDPLSVPGPSTSSMHVDLTHGLLVGANETKATTRLLDNFITIHTSKKKKTGRSSFFAVAKRPAEPEEDAAKLSRVPTAASKTHESNVMADPPMSVPTVPLPCPPSGKTFEGTKLIVATTLRRGIFDHLQSLLPAETELIERDWDRWNTWAWSGSSVKRSPVVSSLAAEADLIIAPSCGVIVTNLITITQKPLPGYRGKAAIRERLEQVSARYERLLVLVSETSPLEGMARELTPPECLAFADFAAFVAGLGQASEVYYVAGGDTNVCTWLVNFINRCSPEPVIQELLIESETVWEVFLRRAGMNAYAAQAVLALLKGDNGNSQEANGESALQSFVTMSVDERIRLFSVIMGGEQILRRVSANLDARWDGSQRLQ